MTTATIHGKPPVDGKIDKGSTLPYPGLENLGYVHWDLSTAALYEEAVRRHEASISHLGPLVARTGHFTGRAPKDKFLVTEPSSDAKIWWGAVNHPFTVERFDAIERRMCAYLQGKDVFVQNCYVGVPGKYRVPIRVITEKAWHCLFARTMFVRELDANKLAQHLPEFTVIHAPDFHADPEWDGTLPRPLSCSTSVRS